VETVANLLTSLHAHGVPDPSYPSLAQRVAHLFKSGTNPYERHPELLELIPRELYERGRRLATRLAESIPPAALLHGDLTPSNILDGGAHRGLVAIDPSPCLGDDAAFDAIDLLLWQAEDVDTIAARASLLGPAIGAETSHVVEWCTAFAAMIALELAESLDATSDRVQTYVALAARAPRH
jgi:streptomycin 6-kinase